MSSAAMNMAMDLFQSNERFREEVRNSTNRGATVSEILSKYAIADEPTKSPTVARQGLTASEQGDINRLPWDSATDDQLIDRIGKAGCTYT